MSGFQASLLCRPSFSPYLPRLAPSLCPHRRVAVTPLFASFSIPYSRRRCLAFPPFRALSEKRDPNLYDVVSSSSPEETGREEQALISGDLGSVEKSSSAAQEKRFPVLVLFVGLWDFLKRGWSKLILSEWLNWWPFWRQEKRLERLIAEADANPKDCAKQSTLLAELNRHSPESVIRRFEQRDHAVDSRGVAEYLRALVVTNSIAEYLPDEQSGKPSSLPMLLEELKERAAGNEDGSFRSPGISEKQPLHVVMVDPKASVKSTRFAQELLSTVIFTVVVGLMWHQSQAAAPSA